VSKKNRLERIAYANVALAFNDKFYNSIFIDESTVQATKNAYKIWNKKFPDETRLGLIEKYSHPESVHVIGGISRRGPTPLIIFKSKFKSFKTLSTNYLFTNNFTDSLNRFGFTHLINTFLRPFIHQSYPNGHRLHMDNARSHVAVHSRNYFIQNNINHFKTPAQSPDLNPIELVWNDLKVFFGEEVKPNTLNELINGINLFWNTKVTVAYCNQKIDHLEKVLKTILIKGGKATGM
jgi:hypothetical protein